MSDRPPTALFRHQPLLGTVVEVRCDGIEDDRQAEAVDAAVVAEIERLERILTVHEPGSELRRWQRGEVDIPSPELAEVLALALGWQARSGGAFNPAAGAVVALWRAAEARGEPPTPAEQAAVSAVVGRPLFHLDPAGIPRLDVAIDPDADRGVIDLNALAKGWIVDRALAAGRALAPPDTDLVVSAGGDLRHGGPGSARVGIENPLRPFDNEPPIVTVEVSDAALATSGRARRGFRIGGRWYGHVVDPRTGATADHVAGITVVAPDTATADVLATVLGLMSPADAAAHGEEQGAACLVVAPDGMVTTNDRWRSLPGAVDTPARVGSRRV
ncbi:MAG: FAD:protein FMN transferase [Acidimicrobiales bacterium]